MSPFGILVPAYTVAASLRASCGFYRANLKVRLHVDLFDSEITKIDDWDLANYNEDRPQWQQMNSNSFNCFEFPYLLFPAQRDGSEIDRKSHHLSQQLFYRPLSISKIYDAPTNSSQHPMCPISTPDAQMLNDNPSDCVTLIAASYVTGC